MSPTFRDGDMVLVSSFSYFFKNPKVGDLAILNKKKYIIKRITRIDGDRFFVEGDNKKESTDSRKFGWISRKDIVGKVLIRI